MSIESQTTCDFYLSLWYLPFLHEKGLRQGISSKYEINKFVEMNYKRLSGDFKMKNGLKDDVIDSFSNESDAKQCQRKKQELNFL